MDLLRRWTDQQGYIIAGETSEIESGTYPDRPGLAEVTQAALAHRMDALVIADLNRLTRSYVDGSEYLEFLQVNGLELISVRDQFTLDLMALRFWA